MDGKATLAMVPSSACMMVAIITTMVIKPRRRLTAGSSGFTAPGSRLGRGRRARETEGPGQPAEQAADRAAVAGVDLDRRAHADAQRRIALAASHGDAHGNALHHLHPV